MFTVKYLTNVVKEKLDTILKIFIKFIQFIRPENVINLYAIGNMYKIKSIVIVVGVQNKSNKS